MTKQKTNDMFITPTRRYQQELPGDTELRKWWTTASLSGLTTESANLARTFIRAAATCSWYNKIIWLWPGLGAGSASFSSSMLVPLIDRRNKGTASFSGSASNVTWSETTGLKKLNNLAGALLPNYTIGDFATNDSGGLGVYCVTPIGGSPNSPMFAVADNSGSVGEWEAAAVRNSNSIIYSYFGTQGVAEVSYTSSFGIGNYYTQRKTSTEVRAFKDGVKKDTRTTSDARINNKNYLQLAIFARRDYTNATTWTEQPSQGTIGAAYITDGTLTDDEVSHFHSVLHTTLVSASGKLG